MRIAFATLSDCLMTAGLVVMIAPQVCLFASDIANRRSTPVGPHRLPDMYHCRDEGPLFLRTLASGQQFDKRGNASSSYEILENSSTSSESTKVGLVLA